MGYESEYKIALEFGVSHDAINRHAQFFGLDAKRMGDTEAMLRVVVAKGFQQFSKTGISEKSWVECIKELNRVAGKRKEPAKNPNDLEEAKRILDWHREHSKDFTEYQIYILLIKPVFPEIRPEQLEIRVEVEGDEEKNSSSSSRGAATASRTKASSSRCPGRSGCRIID